MRFIRHKTHIDFLGDTRRKIALSISALVVVVSIASLCPSARSLYSATTAILSLMLMPGIRDVSISK